MENEYKVLVEPVNPPLQTHKSQLPKIKEVSEKTVDKRNMLFFRFRLGITHVPLFGFFASMIFFLKNSHQNQRQRKFIKLFLVTLTIFGLYHFGHNNFTTDIIPASNIVFINDINNITQSNVITRNVSMRTTLQETGIGMTKIVENRVNATTNNNHAMSLDNTPNSVSIVVVDDTVNFNDGLNRFKEELDSVISFFTGLNSQTSESEDFNVNVKEDNVEGDGVRRLACMSNTRVKTRRVNVNDFKAMRLDKS
ncbi:14232_t:CDS:1 [Dentiscutata erythropus]|uniref:14232_t:CDS:1 n=1 Tax=Dentiscutata erythropus TaxID=1348616 RepID=A0A9N9G120_9GLOM|nr:14232_t:CDS:1 [Dentiscutata erythropus]